ncbi:hypothetical protein [Streptomyces griseus]
MTHTAAHGGLPDLGALISGQIPLPPVGVDIPCSMYASNVPLQLNILGALVLDFKGGINLTVRTSKEDGIVLEVQGFRVEADLSPKTPQSGTLIAITTANATLTPLSALQIAGAGGLEMLIHLSLVFSTIDKATGTETVIAATDPKKYATLRAADVKAFPPVNQQYTLQVPVKLYPQGGSEAEEAEPVGVLEGFDAIWNQSSVPAA